MRGETSLVRSHVRERLLECDDTMLHEGERAEPEESDTRASESPPVPVKVHLDILVEDTVATLDGLSVHTLSEIADLLRQVLDLVKRLSRVCLVEGKEPLRTCSRRHLFFLISNYKSKIYINLLDSISMRPNGVY